MNAQAYVHRVVDWGEGKPLLFLFHGTGGDENQLIALGRRVLPGATLIGPRGDVSEAGAARFFRRTAEGVYDMEDLARATEKMTGFIRAHVAAARPAAVLGLGYSNGANILASVLFGAPDLFDAAVLMHPLIPFAPKIEGSMAGRRILITAGNHDPICPTRMTARLEAWLKDAGADLSTLRHEGGHEMRPEEIDRARDFLSRHADMKGVDR